MPALTALSYLMSGSFSPNQVSCTLLIIDGSLGCGNNAGFRCQNPEEG